MKFFRWLNEHTPGRVLLVNTLFYTTAQVLLWAALAYAISTKDKRVWALFCANVALPPIYIWTSFRTVRRAWMGQPRNNNADEAYPALIVIFFCWLLYLVIS